MLRVPISEALAGMQLALPVVHPQRGSKLLSEGYVLDNSVIVKLRQLLIRDIWIEYPGTEQIKQFVSPTILAQQSQVVELVADMFDPTRREAHAEMDFLHYRRAIQGMIECLVMEPAAASYIVELGGATSNGLRHASEVCFLSVLLGLKLQGYLVQQRKRLLPKDARDVVSLGLGAALHDVGMIGLEPEVRERFEQTYDDRDLQWRQHVNLGHKMISGSIPPAAAGIVLHHHQHFDGTGFPDTMGNDGRPRGLAGEDIHVFARIVCVANHFDRLRRLPGGNLQPRVRVLKQMLAGHFTPRFDPIILATLPVIAPAFPPGTQVTLSSGERAVVIAVHTEAPCQPTVQVLNVEEPWNAAEAAQADPIDLRQRPNLRIVEHENIDVSGDQFRLIPAAHEQEKKVA